MNVFIAYAKEDGKSAEQLHWALRSYGHTVFWDRVSLPAGATWRRRIAQAINESHVFVFLISQYSLEPRRFTQNELAYARARWPHPEDRVVPVLLDPGVAHRIPTYLQELQRVPLEGELAESVCSVVNHIAKRRPHAVTAPPQVKSTQGASVPPYVAYFVRESEITRLPMAAAALLAAGSGVLALVRQDAGLALLCHMSASLLATAATGLFYGHISAISSILLELELAATKAARHRPRSWVAPGPIGGPVPDPVAKNSAKRRADELAEILARTERWDFWLRSNTAVRLLFWAVVVLASSTVLPWLAAAHWALWSLGAALAAIVGAASLRWHVHHRYPQAEAPYREWYLALTRPAFALARRVWPTLLQTRSLRDRGRPRH